jgi:hypothetical protein
MARKHRNSQPGDLVVYKHQGMHTGIVLNYGAPPPPFRGPQRRPAGWTEDDAYNEGYIAGSMGTDPVLVQEHQESYTMGFEDGKGDKTTTS